jgi:HPt (histidine-containing phosphotransfer) domain-containing protein
MEIIDHNQLNECMTGEIDLDIDLMQSAMEELAKRIGEMQKVLANQDYEAWRFNAHRCVGVTATLGFKALAEEFRNAEYHTNKDSERANSLDEINKLIELTQQELKQRGLL